jgi:hypothetical protein
MRHFLIHGTMINNPAAAAATERPTATATSAASCSGGGAGGAGGGLAAATQKKKKKNKNKKRKEGKEKGRAAAAAAPAPSSVPSVFERVLHRTLHFDDQLRASQSQTLLSSGAGVGRAGPTPTLTRGQAKVQVEAVLGRKLTVGEKVRLDEAVRGGERQC